MVLVARRDVPAVLVDVANQFQVARCGGATERLVVAGAESPPFS